MSVDSPRLLPLLEHQLHGFTFEGEPPVGFRECRRWRGTPVKGRDLAWRVVMHAHSPLGGAAMSAQMGRLDLRARRECW